jgi:MinD superfamily P-loop ATPase
MTTKETVGNAICWVGGGKRGVGKSMVTMAILDHLMEMSATALIECDTSNPDVWKAYMT